MKKIFLYILIFNLLGCASAEFKNNNYDSDPGASIEYNIEAMKLPQDNSDTKPSYSEVKSKESSGNDKPLKSPIDQGS